MSEGDRLSLKGGRLLLWGFLLLIGVLFLGRWGAILLTDLLWFSSEGAGRIFWTRLLWEGGVRLAIGGAAGAFAWSSLRMMASSFRGLQIRRRFGDLVILEQVPESYLNWGARGAAAILGIWFALALPSGVGLRGILFLMGGEWGVADPFFERDLGFYLFLVPALGGLVRLALILAFLLSVITLSGYTATGRIAFVRGRALIPQQGPRLHLAILGAALLLLLGVRNWLDAFTLLSDGTSGVQSIFGHADHRSRVPALRLSAFALIAAAPLLIWAVRRGSNLPAAMGVAVLLIATTGTTIVAPVLVQRFRVQPNELDRETPYIEEAIRLTRLGFGLDRMERTRFAVNRTATIAGEDLLRRMERLPIWTESALLTSYRQLEARFRYYDFQRVALGAYLNQRQEEVALVAVGVREIDPAGIPEPDPGWQNLHLRQRYIAGMGAVAGDPTRRTGEGRVPLFLTSIPPEVRPGPNLPEGLELTRPSIFIGSRPQRYAIIDPGQEIYLSPEGEPGVPGVDYPRGIPMGSFLRKLVLAWRLQDPNLLLASEIGAESRLVLRRQAAERVYALAPFLLLPEDPYPVIHEGRIVWIVEGFTHSNDLPLSRGIQLAGGLEVNYLRNSVKAVVDAVTGETRLYLADPEDPIAAAYAKGFPTLLHDIETMPPELRRQLRYPTTLLDAQMQVLARYHQEDPRVFHGQQDLWEPAARLSIGGELAPYRPAYALIAPPGEETPSLALSALFVPAGRQTLAALLVARWNPDSGGEILLWDLPQDEPLQGPRQIDAMVEQDPAIAQQFSLWRQGGSQVWTGHLHLVPAGERIFYMEPVFLAADADAIPEIHRFVVSDGERVVMEPTLEGAVSALLGDATGLPREVPRTRDGGTQAALEALDRAERSLRAGDWAGFGRYLEEVREILRRGEFAAP